MTRVVSPGTVSSHLKEYFLYSYWNHNQIGLVRKQGPVVQSVVSLTNSLRVILLTVLADSIYNILTFFAENM